MGVHFFLDRHAAEAFSFFGPEPPTSDYQAAPLYLAGYSPLGREAFAIAPFGWGGPENEVRLNLDSSGVVRCQYELDGRCLLGLKPLDSDLSDLSGTVTVAATLTRSGVLSDARIIEAKAQEEVRRVRLADLVQRNLPSWWLDPGNRPVAVRITYAVGVSEVSPTSPELDLQYPRALSQAELDRLSPAMRTLTSTEHRKLHFRVTATVAPR